MIEKIISLFNKAGKEIVVFTPHIRIKMTPHADPLWVESMFKVKDNYMVSTINRIDKANRNLNSLNDDELTSLLIRLWSLFGKVGDESK